MVIVGSEELAGSCGMLYKYRGDGSEAPPRSIDQEREV